MKKKPRTTSTNPSSEAKRHKLLQAVLTQIPFDGWTETAFVNGCKQTGIPRAEATQLLPRGLSDLVESFGTMADEAMQARIKAESGFARFRVRDKVIFAIRARLTFLEPYREAVRRSLVWYAMPQHVIQGIKRLAHTVDLIWICSGDTAADYNRYTKRILLAGVLKTTVLFWLNDETPSSEATWAFLDRRIADVMRLGKSISLLQEFSPSELGNFIRRKMGRT